MSPVPTSPTLVAALLALGGAGVVDRIEGDRVVVEWTPAALGAAPLEQAAAVAVRWLELPTDALPHDTREGSHLALHGGVLIAVPPPPPRPGPARISLPQALDLTAPLPGRPPSLPARPARAPLDPPSPPGGAVSPSPGSPRATPPIPAPVAEGVHR